MTEESTITENRCKSFPQVKILFISHEFCIGGSTASLVSLIQGLKNCKGMEVKVLIPYKRDKKANVSKLLESNGICYKEMLYRRNFKSLFESYLFKYRIYDLLNIFAVKRIQKYIQKEKFDVICSNTTAIDVGARAAQIAKIPHIYYVREMMEDGLGCEYRNKQRMKKLLEHSEYVIFISKATKGYYMDNFKLRNTTQFFDGFILQDYYIEKHDILKEEKISFVQVGTFSDGKGTLDTIKLLHQLKQNGISNWTMEFVGKGTEAYIQKMQCLIAKYHLESQIFIGDFCLDIKSKLSHKDILIMNSVAEGFGRVTVEGMLAGCLVIGRYLGGTTEIIMDRINGIAFEKEAEFLNAVQEINDNKDKYRKLAKDGQKYARENFDYINTAKNFIEVVRKCLKQKDMIDEVKK